MGHRPGSDSAAAPVIPLEARIGWSDTRVAEFVRRWRAEGGKPAKSAFVPLAFEFGDAFQFDWSEETLVIGGFHRKVMRDKQKPILRCLPSG